MSKVIELEDYRLVWANWHVVCVKCAHWWAATLHKEQSGFLECSNCGESGGIKTARLPRLAATEEDDDESP